MSVVFTDSFTNSTGSDVRADQWPSAGSPDYAYTFGGTTDIIISNANDRAECPVTGANKAVRIIDAAAPTGDQEITLTGAYGSDNYDESYACVRMATSATFTNLYLGTIEDDTANEIKIYRTDDGSSTLLASQDQGIGIGTQTTYTYRLKATGTNPVALEFQIDSGTTLTYNDSSASRKQTGVPGFGFYNNTGGNTPYIDSVSIDDLAAAGSAIIQPDEMVGGMSDRMQGGMA